MPSGAACSAVDKLDTRLGDMGQNIIRLADRLTVQPDDHVAALQLERSRGSVSGSSTAQAAAEGAASQSNQLVVHSQLLSAKSSFGISSGSGVYEGRTITPAKASPVRQSMKETTV